MTRRQALSWAAVVAVLGAGITATVAVTAAVQDSRAPGAVWARIPGPRAPR